MIFGHWFLMLFISRLVLLTKGASQYDSQNIQIGKNLPRVLADIGIFVPRPQHGLDDHQGDGVSVRPCGTLVGNRKVQQREVIIANANLSLSTFSHKSLYIHKKTEKLV
jgi:hypothetical protein